MVKPKITDWEVKVKVWQRQAVGDNRSATLRYFESHAGQEGYPEYAPNRNTIAKIFSELPNLPPELVVILPPEVQAYAQNLNTSLKEELERLKAGSKSITKGDQEPYEETPHKQRMRELARALAERVNLPSLLHDKDLWNGMPLDFQPGKYSLSTGEVEIDKDGQIKVNWGDLTAGIAEPHLVKGLLSHLSTPPLPRFTELVGDKGKFRQWEDEVGQYSEMLLTFLKLIAGEVKGEAHLDFHNELKTPGLTRWFVLTAWYDAIEQAQGLPLIGYSRYEPHDSRAGGRDIDLWQLKRGANPIGMAKSERTLKKYENWHKQLRAKYAEHPMAKEIAAKDKELSDIVQDIKQRLHEFSDMERLPGHCDLC